METRRLQAITSSAPAIVMNFGVCTHAFTISVDHNIKFCMYDFLVICCSYSTKIDMAESDWDSVTYLKKRTPRAAEMRSKQVCILSS